MKNLFYIIFLIFILTSGCSLYNPFILDTYNGKITTEEPSKIYFYDDFEDGINGWTFSPGNDTLSSIQSLSGSNSYYINADTRGMEYRFYTDLNKIFTVWIYDNVSYNNVGVLAFANNPGTTGIGLNTAISTINYSYRIEGVYYDSGIVRSTGWHELKFDFTSGVDTKLYIDGNLIASPVNAVSFQTIALADWWADGRTSNLFFDDPKVFIE